MAALLHMYPLVKYLQHLLPEYLPLVVFPYRPHLTQQSLDQLQLQFVQVLPLLRGRRRDRQI